MKIARLRVVMEDQNKPFRYNVITVLSSGMV